VFAVQRAEDLIIVVVGGAGKHSACIPSVGASTRAVTLALKRQDGQIAHSVKEFRQG